IVGRDERAGAIEHVERRDQRWAAERAVDVVADRDHTQPGHATRERAHRLGAAAMVVLLVAFEVDAEQSDGVLCTHRVENLELVSAMFAPRREHDDDRRVLARAADDGSVEIAARLDLRQHPGYASL